MAMSLNRAQIIGNLTRDPEVRQIPGGQNVATFSVATNFSWTDSSGQKMEKAEFHNVVAWRKLADICGQYLRKGSKVYIEGRIQTRDWEGEDGIKRYRTEIVADSMIMLDRKGDSVGGGGGYGGDVSGGGGGYGGGGGSEVGSSGADGGYGGASGADGGYGGASGADGGSFDNTAKSGDFDPSLSAGSDGSVGGSAGSSADDEVSIDDLPF